MEPEYSPEVLRQAYAADEVDRLSRMQRERSASYDGLRLTGEAPSQETADITHEDVDGAIFELARERDMDAADMLAMVDALAGGERDVTSRVEAVLTLSAADPDEDLNLFELAVSAEQRQKFAKSGVALPGGHYPIADLKHLSTAKAFYHQGKIPEGVTADEVKKHINARAKALGAEGLGGDDDEDEDDQHRDSTGGVAPRKRRIKAAKPPVRGQRLASQGSAEGLVGYGGGGPQMGAPSGQGEGGAMAASRMLIKVGDTYQTVALTDGQQVELGLVAAESLDPVERIVARHPELFLSMRDSKNSRHVRGAFDPEGPGPQDWRGLPKLHDTGSSQDMDEHTSDVDSEVNRLIHDHPAAFGAEKKRGSWTQTNVTHRR